ncbi:MAG: RsmB/NOP family class I SAM-dependent RNA methyltransferase [bacterium]|nr:RsmB/NOP family class I SAM-dependent RNA methyltransferase [bacterium]
MGMELPQSYQAKMRELLGEEEAEAYFAAFKQKGKQGLRVNRLKLSPQELKERLQEPLSPLPYLPDGFCYEGSATLSKHPYYYAGLYYLQEPSAMTPAFFLSAKPGDKVLDLCAAPGGKSTALGAALKGEGLLFANDISNSRAKALLKNIELAGISNACVSSETPEKLASHFPNFFDKILVDAPCSGEGMFRKDPDLISAWEQRGPERYVPIQREILRYAERMLKPGGILLYSTCTFDKEEDEGNVQYLLDTCPNLSLKPLPLFAGARTGFGLSGCLRLFPHRIVGEGHFLACFQKAAAAEEAAPSSPPKRRQRSFSHPALEEFFTQLRQKPDQTRLWEQNGLIYLLPKDFLPPPKIRYLRTGLLLGELKKDRFEPSQALAMSLSPQDFENTLSLPLSDERVIRYLKGETLSLREEEASSLRNGWCLMAVDGFSLGFAKLQGQSLKNKYYSGWRWQ